jgi:SNF family Na+-dependent transporter
LLVIIILGMFIIPFALVIENFIAEDGVVEGLSRAWNYLSCSFLPMFFILLIIIFLISPKENQKG